MNENIGNGGGKVNKGWIPPIFRLFEPRASILRAAFLGTAVLTGLSGCVTLPAPPTIVQLPMTTVTPQPEPAPSNGAIFQAGTHDRPLFEDRRARIVGDTLVIVLNERTNARKQSNSSVSKNGSLNFGVPPIVFGVPITKKVDIGASSANELDGTGEAASTNNFTGTITVTVLKVLPNRNLLVSGEKQMGINQGTEFIRFSGVVNPVSVTSTNTVSSTRVADARIEYRGNGYVSEAQTMGWLSRVFMNIWPF